MTRIRTLVLVAAAVGAPTPPFADRDVLTLEWADRDPEALGGAVFVRKLYCRRWEVFDVPRPGSVWCSLTTITVGRICPFWVIAAEYRPEDGLKVERRGDDVDIEVDQVTEVTRFNVRLHTSTKKSPHRRGRIGRSYLEAYRPERADARCGTRRLRAEHQGNGGLPRVSEVELNCSRIAVVAAKKSGK